MKFISIKFKENYTDYLRILLLLLFSFFICYYYGFKGIIPLDDFVNLNSGYRVFNGDLPFRDYYEITGPALSIIQSIFFNIFGLSWKSYVLHSSVINCITSIIIYIYFLNILENKNLSLIISILFAVLFYPNNGVPGVDHHAWALAIASLLLFNIGFEKKKYSYVFFSIFAFFISFFIKQVPAAYIFILMGILYFSQSIHEKKIIYLFRIILTTLVFLFLIIFMMRANGIDLQQVFQQYFLMLFNFGSERIIKIKIYLIKENLSQIYFLFFLIFPTIFLFFKKKNINFSEKKFFIIILSLILSAFFYEIHTNNQAMTFALIPIISGLIFQIQRNLKDETILKYIYVSLIIVCIFKIIQFEANFLYLLIIFLIANFYLLKKKKFFFNLNFLLVIYLLVTSFYYFELNIKSRKYKDISFDKKIISFDGAKIHKFFENFEWKINSKISADEYIKEKKDIISLLEKFEKNYIFITDYQFYNLILQKKDFSPVKYWSTEISYPSKKNKLRDNFEEFFFKKIIDNNIEYIIFDQTTSTFNENILDYSFLSKCFENKIIDEDLKLEIFKFRFNCF